MLILFLHSSLIILLSPSESYSPPQAAYFFFPAHRYVFSLGPAAQQHFFSFIATALRFTYSDEHIGIFYNRSTHHRCRGIS